jgi:hypothetical protein
MTATWQIRDFQTSDLEALVRLDAASPSTGEPPVFSLADVVNCLDTHPAVVAGRRCVAAPEDCLAAIHGTRPTLTAGMLAEFTQDVE